MRVVIITGDRTFGPGHPRYELQRAAVEALAVMYWGHGGLFPRTPKGTFDVVTVQDPFFRGLFALHVARRLRAPLNVQVHADIDGQSFVKRLLARFVLRRAHTIRVVSERIKKQVGHFGVPAKIAVLPIFIDVSAYSSVVRRPHPSKNILWIGRFEEEKDPLLMVEIFKKVLKNLPEARLTMLGRGSLDKRLAERAAGLPVTLPGWEPPAPFLATADAVLSTSRHESWGASIVEALASGVPVVAPDVGIAREAGAIVVPRNQLADAVIEVLRTGAKGELRLQLPNAHEWATRWRDSLLQ